SGNVSIYAMEKAIKLGAKVIACSDSSGYVYDADGLSLKTVKQIKLSEARRIKEYIKVHPEARYNNNSSGIWSVPCDIAMPCATQNELDLDGAKRLIRNGVKIVAEGANMPSTIEAIDLFHEHDVLFAPAQAVNAGGVAVSALEMAQNSSRVAWTFEEVDDQLQEIMENIYRQLDQVAREYGHKGDVDKSANNAGFKRIADAMIVQGVV